MRDSQTLGFDYLLVSIYVLFGYPPPNVLKHLEMSTDFMQSLSGQAACLEKKHSNMILFTLLYLFWIWLDSVQCILHTVFRNGSGMEPSMVVQCLFFMNIAAWRLMSLVNKWKSFSNTRAEPQSSGAEWMEMWAEWAARFLRTRPLWLWPQVKEETRTLLSQKE